MLDLMVIFSAQVAAAPDRFLDWATVGVAVATAGLLIAAIAAGRNAARGVGKQIDEQRLIQRRARVFDLQGVLSARDFIAMSAEAFTFMQAFTADRAAAATDWTQTSNLRKLRVLAVLNFYELVATEYNNQFLDREAANKNLAYAVVIAWIAAEDFVTYLRETDPAYFAEWKYLYDHHRETIIGSTVNGQDSAGSASASPSAGAAARLASQAPPAGEEMHLPGPTILPLLAAAAITMIVIGTTISFVISIIGLILLGVITGKWIRAVHADVGNLPSETQGPRGSLLSRRSTRVR